jgi:hypothetical protein
MRKKTAFLFFPHTASVEKVADHLTSVKEKYPDAITMLSIPRNRDDLYELAKSADFVAKTNNEETRLIRRALPLLSEVGFSSIDTAVFVTATLRYSPALVANFAEKCRVNKTGNLLLGEPPVMNPERNEEIMQALTNPDVLRNVMVDVFTSFLACKTNSMIYGKFMNLNAGLFALRMDRSADAHETLRTVFSKKMLYRDSDLLPLSLALSMAEKLSVRTIPLESIDLDPFTNNLARRIADLRFVLETVTNMATVSSPEDLLREVFDSAYFKKIFREEQREWFAAEVLQLKAGDKQPPRKAAMSPPPRTLPEPNYKPKK